MRNLQKTLAGDEDDAPSENDRNATGTAPSSSGATETMQQRVVNELIAEARNENVDNEENAVTLTLPVATNESTATVAEESNLDDYEKVPISQYGLAMLRGMGVKDEDIRSQSLRDPELRPKGMGLGADKLTKPKKLLVAPAANETLEIKKNACVRILAGKYKDLYGQVSSESIYYRLATFAFNVFVFRLSFQIEGLDDDAGRIIVKMALGGKRETLNEFMVQPVSKQEYAQYGKVINSAKYDEYKKKQENAEKLKAENRRTDSAAVGVSSSSSSNRRHSPLKEETRRRDRSRDDRDRHNQRSTNRERDERRRSKDRNSPNRYRERHRSRSRSRDRRDRSTERNASSAAAKSVDRSKSHKTDRRRSVSSSSSKSSESSSDSSSRRSHKKHSKKKHKKHSKSHDDRHVKKKTKKSKRQRSRSRGRD